MNKHFYHDISIDQMLQLLKTASTLELSPHYECAYTVKMIHRIIVKALSFRCISHHGWAMPEPLPDRKPREVILRSGRTVTVMDSQITKERRHDYLLCAGPSEAPGGVKHVLLHLDGCSYSSDGEDAFSTSLLRGVVNTIKTDVFTTKYWCPIGDEPLEVTWSLKSDAFWPKIMSFRLDDAMSYVYDD